MRKSLVLLALSLIALSATAQNSSTLAQRIQKITGLPIFKNADLGIEIYDLTAQKTLLAINENKLFTSGSTTKIVTEGSALALLGENYRFHTRVYYNGTITPDGTLEGDLILVASGDPNLSGRVLANDTLDFTSSDHAYAGVLPGKSVLGDPLRVMKQLASGVFMKGIWRIRGNIVVDASLFPSNQVEPATHATISPIILNDNIIDVIATPARNAGGPVALTISPDLPYLKVINKVVTGKPDSNPILQFTSDSSEPDGSHIVVLEGNVPAGVEKSQAAYKVKDPVLFATEGFRTALLSAPIVLEEPEPAEDAKDPTPLPKPAKFQQNNSKFLVEYVSPPFKQEVKLTLKASQNLHAATTPYLVGAIVGHSSSNAFQKGMSLQRHFLADAGLHPETVSQLDGEGGIGSAFSPDFMVRYLVYMSRQPYGKILFDALPILGRDGTLEFTMEDSPAAGHVHAKTGSYIVSNSLTGGVMLLGKGLVGYIDAANGHRLLFAAYASNIPLHDMDDTATVGENIAQMAAIAYQYAPPGPKPASKPAPKNPKRTSPSKPANQQRSH